MSESKIAAEQVDDYMNAIKKAVVDVLAKHLPEGVSSAKVQERLAAAAMSFTPTRTTLLALTAFVGIAAYNATLSKESVLAIVGELYDKIAAQPLSKIAAEKYANVTAQIAAKAEAAAAGYVVAGTDKIH